jgi:hypothetical protein
MDVLGRVAVSCWALYGAIVRWCLELMHPTPGFDPRSVSLRHLDDWPAYTQVHGVTTSPSIIGWIFRYLIAFGAGLAALVVLAVGCVFFVLSLPLKAAARLLYGEPAELGIGEPRPAARRPP